MSTMVKTALMMIKNQENREKIPPHNRINRGVPDFSADACRLSFSIPQLLGITIMTESSGTLAAMPTALCESSIANWADNYGVTNPIVCDIDSDGNGHGDATDQGWSVACGGTPQNFYIDQGFRNYDFVCGGEHRWEYYINRVRQ